MKERTLAIIKPNALRKKVAGKILAMWEEAGFDIVAVKKATLTRAQAEGFYAEHKEKEFFPRLIDFMTSGPVILLVLERENAVAGNRDLMGATNPDNAAAGTMRRLFGDSLTMNAVHGSDAQASAAREVAYFFNALELNP
jgi:nucleoside-diphosphate kinase